LYGFVVAKMMFTIAKENGVRTKCHGTKCHAQKKTPGQNATQEMNGRTKCHWRTDSLSWFTVGV